MSAGDDVAIVGAGIHQFGRHDGVTGLEMGAIAARRALADAGIAWQEVDFAAGGRTPPATRIRPCPCSG